MYILSLYLFVLVIDDFTRHIQNKASWCILFADYSILIDDIRAGITYKVGALERSVRSQSVTSVEVKLNMKCKFSNRGKK